MHIQSRPTTKTQRRRKARPCPRRVFFWAIGRRCFHARPPLQRVEALPAHFLHTILRLAGSEEESSLPSSRTLIHQAAGICASYVSHTHTLTLTSSLSYPPPKQEGCSACSLSWPSHGWSPRAHRLLPRHHHAPTLWSSSWTTPDGAMRASTWGKRQHQRPRCWTGWPRKAYASPIFMQQPRCARPPAPVSSQAAWACGQASPPTFERVLWEGCRGRR